MYDINPKPNSDEAICSNCQIVKGKDHITETVDGDSGCVNCVSQCGWCGNHYLNEDMFNNPYLGYVCKACENAEDYMKASEDELLKDALMCYFNDIDHKGIIQLIINYAIKKGYNDLANELNNDKS